MERSKSKLSKFVRRVIRPLTGCETGDLVHASPVKSKAKNWASKSLRIFSGAFLPSTGVKDDASSFMSPMPDELYSPPSGDKFSSKDSSDWSGDKSDSFRLSFIHCAEIIDLFPATPVVSRSQAMHSLHQLSRASRLAAISHDFSYEFDEVYGPYHPGDDTSWRALKEFTRRGSTPFPFLSSLMPSKYPPPSVASDMVTRARHLCSDNCPSHCDSDLDGSPPDYFSSLSTGFTSTQISQQSLGSPPFPSPSFTMPLCSNMSSSSNLIPTHLTTNASLQGLSESRPSLSSSPSLPSSPRSATSHVPGLEHRASGSLRRRLNPIYGSANPDESHVPYGTIQF